MRQSHRLNTKMLRYRCTCATKILSKQMANPVKEWNGEEWQEHIAQLLRARYSEPGMYQEMPSRDKGDLGLEGFSRDGICYQCYAAEPPFTVKILYEKQRNKITDDISKFIKNSKRLAAVFGTLKIKRWLLVVPQFFSTQLLEHCSSKKDDVIGANLAYLDGQFDVGVITDSEFTVELCKLAAVHLYQHDIVVGQPDVAQIQQFSLGNVTLLANVANKASKLPKLDTVAKVDEFTLRMVHHYLRGQAAVEALRSRDPEQFETLLRCKNTMEDMLVIQSMVQTGDASTVRKTFSEFKNEVEKNVSVSPHTADVVAWGAVADWLLRCPLDF
jgi:hypothetical protein